MTTIVGKMLAKKKYFEQKNYLFIYLFGFVP
jgi:hypothetical protein